MRSFIIAALAALLLSVSMTSVVADEAPKQGDLMDLAVPKPAQAPDPWTTMRPSAEEIAILTRAYQGADGGKGATITVERKRQPDWSFGADLISKYLPALGYDLGGPAVQTSVSASWPSGFYVGGWWSYGLDDLNPDSNFTDEINLSSGVKASAGPFQVDLGLDYWIFNEFGEPGNDVLRPRLAVSHTSRFLGGTLAKTFQVEDQIKLSGDHPDRWITSLKLDWRKGFAGRFALNLGVKLSYDGGREGGADNGWILQPRIGVELPAPFWKGATLEPFVKWAILGGIDDIRGAEGRAGDIAFGLSIKF